MDCKCTFSQSMVGDGCDICNPAKALDICRENYAELERAARRLVEAVHRREMSYGLIPADEYEVYSTSKEILDADEEWNTALAEVEALLKEGE